MHIDHIAVWTNDLERLRDFYTRHFRCLESSLYVNPVKKFSSYFLSFDTGSRFEIMKREDITEARPPEMIGLAHFAIRLNSALEVDELTQKLRDSGVVVLSNPRLTGDGYYESVIADPDGNQIELISSPKKVYDDVSVNYDGRKFRVMENNGELITETVFEYKQTGNILTSQYAGGNVILGQLMGLVDRNGNINMRYHQVNQNNEIRTGICYSIPQIMPDGKTRLYEKWLWTSGEFQQGRSILEEILV